MMAQKLSAGKGVQLSDGGRWRSLSWPAGVQPPRQPAQAEHRREPHITDEQLLCVFVRKLAEQRGTVDVAVPRCLGTRSAGDTRHSMHQPHRWKVSIIQ